MPLQSSKPYILLSQANQLLKVLRITSGTYLHGIDHHNTWTRSNEMSISSTVLSNPGLYVGGLRTDLHPGKLAGLVANMLWKFKVQCQKQNIYVVIKRKTAYALVELPDKETVDFILSQFSSVDKIQDVFDLRNITDNPGNLKIARKHERSNRKRSRSRGRKSQSRGSSVDNHRPSVTGSSSLSHSLSSISSATNLQDAEPRNINDVPPLNTESEEICSRRSCSETSCQIRNHSVAGPSKALSDVEIASKDNLLSLHLKSDLADDEKNTLIIETLKQEVSFASGAPLPPKSKTESSTPTQHSQASLIQNSSHDFPSQTGSGVVLPPQKSAATSTTGIHKLLLSKTTSTPSTSIQQRPTFYKLGEIVGRETRHHEFKAGGMTYKDRGWLQETVGKYICGFLNSGEGGTLYIGVNDAGNVIGCSCTQAQEDDYRLLIDEAVKSIEPAIFTDAYMVRFVSIMETSGRLSHNLKVLEIEVNPIGHLKQLYDFRGHAYVRRDGSLQGPLKSRQIQEWMRKQLEKEHLTTKHLDTQIQEMNNQLETERLKNEEVRQQLVALEERLKLVPLTRKKSKVCILM